MSDRSFLLYAKIAPMNIRTYLSWTRGGAEEKLIEYIELAIVEDRCFGLQCERSKVIFFPAQLKAFWLWSDLSQGPKTTYDSFGEFMTALRGQMKHHKELLTTEQVMELTLQFREQHNMGPISGEALSEPGEPAGALVTSAD